MASFFSKLFAKKSTSVLGIDIGSSSIKVVELATNSGKPTLLTYGEIALGPYAGMDVGQAVTAISQEKITEALVDIIREAKVVSRNSGLSVPFASSLIAAIEMPALDEAKLTQMIPLEARKYIPVPINEVVLDWIILPKAANQKKTAPLPESSALSPQTGSPLGEAIGEQATSEKVDVLLVAIHNEILARYQAIISQAQLGASFFEIEIFSTMRSIMEQDAAVQMIIDLGAASTKLYIIEGGIIRTSHIVMKGSQTITLELSKKLAITVEQAENFKRNPSLLSGEQKTAFAIIVSAHFQSIFSDIEHVRIIYQKKSDKLVSKIALVGGGALVEGALAQAEDYFKAKVTLGDPFNKTQAQPYLQEVLKTTGPEFAVAIGIALRKIQE